MHKGEKPNIVAGAYTNSVKGAKETALVQHRCHHRRLDQAGAAE